MEPEHEHHGGFLAREIDKLEPIPVRVVELPDGRKSEPADFGGFNTIRFITGQEGPQQLLRQVNTRKKARIIVMNGFLNNNNVGYLVLGSRSQVQNAGITGDVGGIVVSGTSFDWETTGELWVCGDGAHSLTITAVDQRYQE